MDTTDPAIAFDERGQCNHCRQYQMLAAHHIKSGEEGQRELEALVNHIKTAGRQKSYDCVIGVSEILNESILRESWTYGGNDWRYSRGVHRCFGTRTLRTCPHYGLGTLNYYSSVKRIRAVRVLDYVPYIRSDAMRVLQDDLG